MRKDFLLVQSKRQHPLLVARARRPRRVRPPRLRPSRRPPRPRPVWKSYFRRPTHRRPRGLRLLDGVEVHEGLRNDNLGHWLISTQATTSAASPSRPPRRPRYGNTRRDTPRPLNPPRAHSGVVSAVSAPRASSPSPSVSTNDAFASTNARSPAAALRAPPPSYAYRKEDASHASAGQPLESSSGRVCVGLENCEA